MVTSKNKKYCNMRVIKLLDLIRPKKYFRATYLYTLIEYITKPITQEIHAFNG